jgi:predicted Zn finger-like uncharacterized protein
MNVTCPDCHTVYRVDPRKIPVGGVRARCARCPADFAVETAVVVDSGHSVTTEAVEGLYSAATAFTGDSMDVSGQHAVGEAFEETGPAALPEIGDQDHDGTYEDPEGTSDLHGTDDLGAAAALADDADRLEFSAAEANGDEFSSNESDVMSDIQLAGFQTLETYSESYSEVGTTPEEAYEPAGVAPLDSTDDQPAVEGHDEASARHEDEGVFEAELESTSYDSSANEYSRDGAEEMVSQDSLEEDRADAEATLGAYSADESPERFDSVTRSEAVSVFLVTDEGEAESTDSEEHLEHADSHDFASSRVEVTIEEPAEDDYRADAYGDESSEASELQAGESAVEEMAGMEAGPGAEAADAVADAESTPEQEAAVQAPVAVAREEVVAAELGPGEGFAEVPSRSDADLTLPPPPFGSSDPHARARRLARALVSDIVVYHPDRRERSIRLGTVRQEFREEIRKSWDEYVSHVGNQMARDTAYFRDALNELLAGGANVF